MRQRDTRGQPYRPAYRLLACDVDDTLVRFPDPPSPRVVRAIRAAGEVGVTVALVTGRAFRRARPVARALGLATPIVCNHGGSIRDATDGSTLHRETLPRAFTLDVVRWLQTQDVYIMLFDGDRVVCDCTPDEVVPDFQVYTRGAHAFHARDLLAHVPEHTEIILNTARDHARLAAVYERAQARWGTQARVLFSHPFGVDIMPHSSKSASLAWLVEHLGIARQEVMAIGDGENDVDMLAWAGLGVAMGNAAPEARAAAHVVAPPFEEDGAAWAVERYLLGRGEIRRTRASPE